MQKEGGELHSGESFIQVRAVHKSCACLRLLLPRERQIEFSRALKRTGGQPEMMFVASAAIESLLCPLSIVADATRGDLRLCARR